MAYTIILCLFITHAISNLKDNSVIIYILLREVACQGFAHYWSRLWDVLWKGEHFLWGWHCALFQLVNLADEAGFFCGKMAILADMERVPVTLTVHCLLTEQVKRDERFSILKWQLPKMPSQNECHLSTMYEFLTWNIQNA